MAERPEAVSRSLLITIVAGDDERRLAVHEVEAGFRDDDLVFVQLQATLSERLVSVALPLQLSWLFAVVVTCKQSRRCAVRASKRTLILLLMRCHVGQLIGELFRKWNGRLPEADCLKADFMSPLFAVGQIKISDSPSKWMAAVALQLMRLSIFWVSEERKTNECLSQIIHKDSDSARVFVGKVLCI